ncbi:MAG: response regulator transcription factor [Arcanobacterium sp.]|nr:response regulator transcription factor [Arcanobacterium sp.]MDY5589271.1 response regulator transcription factor [Arcanobacterium sp.]
MALQALIVDDDPQIASIVQFSLETQGFEATIAASGEAAWKLFEQHSFQLLVLDVMLPGLSGIQLTKRIRVQSAVPIIILSALGEEAQRIAGLEAGANDYVVKPFSPRELALRAVLAARSGAMHTATRENGDITNGPLTLNVAAGTALWENQRLVITETELRFLAALAQAPGKVFSTRELLNEVWQTSETAGGRDMIKSTVYRLRHGVLEDVAHSDLIISVRGHGYAMQRLQ